MKKIRKWLCMMLSVLLVFFEVPFMSSSEQTAFTPEITAEAAAETSLGNFIFNGLRYEVIKYSEGYYAKLIGSTTKTTLLGDTTIKIPASFSRSGFSDMENENLKKISKDTSITSIPVRYTELVTNMATFSGEALGYGIFGAMSAVQPKELIFQANLWEIGDSSFMKSATLEKVTIPYTTYKIGKKAFYGCINLTEVTIKYSHCIIDSTAFDMCNKLTTIYGYSGSTAETFANQKNLTFIALDNPQQTTPVYTDTSVSTTTTKTTTATAETTTVTSESKATDITRGNLKYHLNETGDTLTISGTGDMINFSNISYQLKLKNVTKVVIEHGVTSIEGRAFLGCSNLKSVTISNSVKIIGSDAFSGCTSLTSVTIPDSVTSIKGGAFSGCTSLTSFILPSSLTTIEGRILSGCSKLKSIDIPENITSIGAYAFSDCSSLVSITIPRSVTSIGTCAFAFQDTSKYHAVYIHNPQCKFETAAISKYVTIYGYSNSTAQAFADDNGNEFVPLDKPETTTSTKQTTTTTTTRQTTTTTTTIMTTTTAAAETTHVIMPEEGTCGENLTWNLDSKGTLTISGTGAMYDWNSNSYDDNLSPWCCNQDVTQVIIEEDVTSIGNAAFYNCSELKFITIKNPDCTIYDSEYTISDTAAIYGMPDSTAQDYAEKYNRVYFYINNPQNVEAIALARWEIGCVSAHPGDCYVKVPVWVEGLPEGLTLNAFDFKLNVSSDVDFSDYSFGSAYAIMKFFVDTNTLRFAGKNLENQNALTQNGASMMTLFFNIPSNIKAGRYRISFDGDVYAANTHGVIDIDEVNGYIDIFDDGTVLSSSAVISSAVTTSTTVTDINISDTLNNSETEFAVTNESSTVSVKESTAATTVTETKPLVAVKENEITLKAGQQYQIEANQDNLTYFSSNTEIAAVSSNGMITALSEGNTIISVVNQDYDVMQIKVTVIPSDTETALEFGDLNNNGAVNAEDASLILIAAAKQGSGQDSGLTETQKTAADVNQDGKINASDAAYILQYAAAAGAGAFSGTLSEYMNSLQ